MNSNKLICKICGYESKQLHQHIRAVHNISSAEYRGLFGTHQQMQVGFKPPDTLPEINITQSNRVIETHKLERESLMNITDLYNPIELIELLSNNNLYLQYSGKSKYRKLIKDNPKLYKSIFFHTNHMETKFPDASLTRRLEFIVIYKLELERVKCECGETYTFNRYCRQCPEPRKTMLGKPKSSETKAKSRISAINYINSCAGKCVPRYNKNSISIIEEYGAQHGYHFQHAENGGEYHIKELGYFVDGYDKENNTVIEIDEPHHFDKKGNLLQCDITRQNEIEEFLKCKFIRIKL